MRHEWPRRRRPPPRPPFYRSVEFWLPPIAFAFYGALLFGVLSRWLP